MQLIYCYHVNWYMISSQKFLAKLVNIHKDAFIIIIIRKSIFGGAKPKEMKTPISP